MTESQCLHGNTECKSCGFPQQDRPMTDETLLIHETALEDAAFKIACDLADRGMILPIAVNTVTTAVKYRLLHQLHLQRTWTAEDDDVTTRQLWSRPVQPA